MEPAVCACCRCPISGESLSCVVDAVTSSIHIVLSHTFRACGDAVSVHVEWVAFHGYGVMVEAVGAFCIVGVERCRIAEVAVSHDDAVIHAEVSLSLQPLVDGVEDGLGG